MKKSYPYIFTIVILVVLLGISLYLGFSGYLFSVAMNNISSDLSLGETVEVEISPNETSVFSFTLDGSYLPNEKIPQVVQIRASDVDKEMRVRVKAEIFARDKLTPIDFVANQNFLKATDGYFYLNGNLAGGNKVTFCDYIVIPAEAKLNSKEKYVLTIVVENIDASLENIWGDFEIA